MNTEQKEIWFKCLEEWYEYTSGPVTTINQILSYKELTNEEKLKRIKQQSDKCFGYQKFWRENEKYLF